MERQSLMELLTAQTEVEFLSDLKNPTPDLRKRLIRVLKQTASEDFYLSEWNDALDYLCRAMPETDRDTCKRKLIILLKGKIFRK